MYAKIGQVQRRATMGWGGSDVVDQPAAPALDGLGHVPEGVPALGQLVTHADRRSGLDAARDDPARLEVLEPRRQRLVADAAGALAELAEAQRPALQQDEDLAGPRATEHLDRGLVR